MSGKQSENVETEDRKIVVLRSCCAGKECASLQKARVNNLALLSRPKSFWPVSGQAKKRGLITHIILRNVHQNKIKISQ